MKTHFFAILVTTMAFITPSALGMEKGEPQESGNRKREARGRVQETSDSEKAHSPLHLLRFHPTKFTWANLKEVMDAAPFEKLVPESESATYEHCLEDDGYYFTFKCVDSLKKISDLYHDLSFRLDLIQNPENIGLATQLEYEIVVLVPSGDQRVTRILVSYVRKDIVKIAGIFPAPLKKLQRRKSESSLKKFMSGSVSRVSELSEVKKDMKKRTEKSEQNAKDAKQSIRDFYATLALSPRTMRQRASSSAVSDSSSSTISSSPEQLSVAIVPGGPADRSESPSPRKTKPPKKQKRDSD